MYWRQYVSLLGDFGRIWNRFLVSMDNNWFWLVYQLNAGDNFWSHCHPLCSSTFTLRQFCTLFSLCVLYISSGLTLLHSSSHYTLQCLAMIAIKLIECVLKINMSMPYMRLVCIRVRVHTIVILIFINYYVRLDDLVLLLFIWNGSDYE